MEKVVQISLDDFHIPNIPLSRSGSSWVHGTRLSKLTTENPIRRSSIFDGSPGPTRRNLHRAGSAVNS